ARWTFPSLRRAIHIALLTEAAARRLHPRPASTTTRRCRDALAGAAAQVRAAIVQRREASRENCRRQSRTDPPRLATSARPFQRRSIRALPRREIPIPQTSVSPWPSPPPAHNQLPLRPARPSGRGLAPARDSA